MIGNSIFIPREVSLEVGFMRCLIAARFIQVAVAVWGIALKLVDYALIYFGMSIVNVV